MNRCYGFSLSGERCKKYVDNGKYCNLHRVNKKQKSIPKCTQSVKKRVISKPICTQCGGKLNSQKNAFGLLNHPNGPTCISCYNKN